MKTKLLTLLKSYITILLKDKSCVSTLNEYYVEFVLDGRTQCMFGVMAEEEKKAIELVRLETNGVVTQVAVRTPKDDIENIPSYYIVYNLKESR